MCSLALLDIIAGKHSPSGGANVGLYEIRQLWDAGAAQSFHPVADRDACAREIMERGPRGDTYIGATLRTDRKGSADTCKEAWALWADCDAIDAVERLPTLPPPTLTVRSGTENNLHAWWALAEPIPAAKVKRANRRLVYHLGADMRVTDVARVMRAPGTLNFKTDPPRPVEVVTHDPFFSVYAPGEIIGELPDPPTEAPRPPRIAGPRINADDPLKAIPADVYYSRLTGREGEILRHVKCPFWEHQSPRQMMLYPDGSWFCWPCEAGGTIIDFAARLWDMGTWGDDFKRLRERLLDELG